MHIDPLSDRLADAELAIKHVEPGFEAVMAQQVANTVADATDRAAERVPTRVPPDVPAGGADGGPGALGAAEHFRHAKMTHRKGLDALENPIEHDDLHDRAEKAAKQFEAIFVKTIIEKMRENAQSFGEGGVFGKAVGGDTYNQWFDQHMAEHVSDRSNGGQGLGVVEAIMKMLERQKQIPATGTHTPDWHHDEPEVTLHDLHDDGTDPMSEKQTPGSVRDGETR